MNTIVHAAPGVRGPSRSPANSPGQPDEHGFELALGLAAAAHTPAERVQSSDPAREQEDAPRSRTDGEPADDFVDSASTSDGEVRADSASARPSGPEAGVVAPAALAAAAQGAGEGPSSAMPDGRAAVAVPVPVPATATATAAATATVPASEAQAAMAAEFAARSSGRVALAPEAPGADALADRMTRPNDAATAPLARIPLSPLQGDALVSPGASVRVVASRTSNLPRPGSPAEASGPNAAAAVRPVETPAPRIDDAPASPVAVASPPGVEGASLSAPVRAAVASAFARSAAAQVANDAALELHAGQVPDPVPIPRPIAALPGAARDPAGGDPAKSGETSARPVTPDILAPRAEASLVTRPAVPASAPAESTPDRTGGHESSQRESRDGAARREPNVPSAPAPAASAAVPANAGALRSMQSEPTAVTGKPGPEVVPLRDVQDPRLEPMRRAADQVTLQFQGEGGLEGRLRISVRGDHVRASILSSHDGTLQRLGSDLAPLRKALAEQGFSNAKLALHDTRAAAAGEATGAREQGRPGEDRKQGEPQRRSPQGREARQDGRSPNGEQRGSRDERRGE